MNRIHALRHIALVVLFASLLVSHIHVRANPSFETPLTLHELDSSLNLQHSNEERAALLLSKGKLLQSVQRPMKAKMVFEELMELDLPRTDYFKGLANYQIAEIYYSLDNIDAALEHNSRASNTLKSGNKASILAEIKIQRAGFIKSEGIYLEAIKLYEEALEIFQNEGQKDSCARTQHLMGLLEIQFENYEVAEQLISEALDFFTYKGFDQEALNAVISLLDLYEKTKASSLAISLAEKYSIKCVEGNRFEEAAILKERIALFYREELDYRSAIEIQKEVLVLKTEYELDDLIPSMLILGNLHEEALHGTEAKIIYSDALEMAAQTNNIEQEQIAALFLSEFYVSVENPIKGLHYLKISDSLKTVQLQILNNQLQRESNLQFVEEAELIQAQTLEKQKFEEAKRKLGTRTLIGAAIAVFVIILLLVYGYLQMKKQSKLFEWKVYKRTQQLRRVNGELNTFIYKSSHDLRTPLTNIKSLLRLLNKEEHNAASNKYLNLINSSTEQMDNILINLSEAVDYKKVDVKINKVDFSQIKYDVDNKEVSSGKAINVNWNIVEKAPFFSDEKFIKVILRKTIANARNYRSGSDEDFCNITITTDRNGADVSVEDNGVGIADKVKDNVFEMFVKGSNKSKGAGLGLYLVKIATDKIKGKISLESTEKKGSKLLFHLPNLN